MRKLAVAAAVLGVAGHVVVTIALLLRMVTEAYAFSDRYPERVDVGSYDQLSLLGWSPSFGVMGLGFVGLADALFTSILLARPSTRTRAWIVPLVAIVVSTLIIYVAITSFQIPPVNPGGG